jgi:CheY-like chemotaxis protein
MRGTTLPDTVSDRPASGTVLIVEDNDTTRDRMAAALRARGYDVAEATDGFDAFQKVRQRRFDAILLDLVLPNVDGWQFRETQLRHPELALIPTVIVTVRALTDPERYSLRTSEVVRKPFEDAALVEAVDRACRIRQPVSPPPLTAVDALFWSRRGEIACADHAPDATSPRWREEGWVVIAVGAGKGRISYRCQHCSGDGSPIDRSHRSVGPHGRRGSEEVDS